ncbi:MAG: sigma-70 family RNA polymerase sigma factor [Sphingomonas fennica]
MYDLEARLDWFKAVILPHRAALFGRVMRITPPGTDVEDIVAEALSRAYAARDWAGVTNGRAYLFRIARNLLIDGARREAVVSFGYVADIESLQVDHGTEDALCARAELRRLQAIVNALPGQCRTAFILRRVEEWTMPAIAERMGLSVSTVEKHLAKAVMLVKRGMATTEDDGDERSLPAPAPAAGDRRTGRTARR